MSTDNKLITAEAALFTSEQKDLIKTVLFKGATDTEIQFYWNVAERLKLDPFKRQIHAMKRWNGATEREEMQFMVSIEGLRSIASRCKTDAGKDAYAGSTKPKFTFNEKDELDSAEVTVFRIVQGEPREFTAEVFFTECVQTKGIYEYNKSAGKKVKVGEQANSMWTKRPRGQLGKCAEAAALRKAFPEETGGVYIEDELPDHDDDKPQKAPKPSPEAEGMAKRQDAPEKAKTTTKPEPAADGTIEAELVTEPADDTPAPRHWSDLRLEKAYNLVRFPENSPWPNQQVWQIEKAGQFGEAFKSVPRADAGQQESIHRLALDCKYFAKVEARITKKGYDLDDAAHALLKAGFFTGDTEITDIPGDRLEDLATAVNDLPDIQ